ncbi:MAG: UDP-N-acetylglucosamine--N-acetylmuramyl-(pentapeptide) pyrophosphoryl-undecaprenol N-acetylglucosamine transferase, partial [Bacteroidetes bacterium]
KHFDPSKVVITGNPIRTFTLPPTAEARERLGLDPARPTLLSLGGSLGALRINEALEAQLEAIIESGVQLIWQCGKRYHAALAARVPQHPQIKLMPFIEDMAAAYAAADLIISRAGGSTISELIALEKPSVLVPSPNVSEDHQTKNALSLSEKGAARLVKDVEAYTELVPVALDILRNPEILAQLQSGIAAMEKHDAAREIVDEIMKHLK